MTRAARATITKPSGAANIGNVNRVHVPTAVTAPTTHAARVAALRRRRVRRAASFFASDASSVARADPPSTLSSSSPDGLSQGVVAHAKQISVEMSTHSTAFVNGRTRSVTAGQEDATNRRARNPARAAPEKLFSPRTRRASRDAFRRAGDRAQYAARAARAAARSTTSEPQNANTRGARKSTAGETRASAAESAKASAKSSAPPPTRAAASRSPAATPRASAARSQPPAAAASIARATCLTFRSKRARNRQTRKDAPAARTCPTALRAGAPAASNSQARGAAATPSTSRALISTVWWYSSGWTYAVPSTAQARRNTSSAPYSVSRAPTDHGWGRARREPRRFVFDRRAERLAAPALVSARVSSSSVSASRWSRSTPPYTTRLRVVGLATALARTLRGRYGFE